MSQNPFLFVGGVPRSGTTLLQRMLDNHPDLTVSNDSHFIPRVLELGDKSALRDCLSVGDTKLTSELFELSKSYHRTYRLGLSDTQFDLARDNATTYTEYVSRLYDEVARNAGKTLAGEKTPDYVRRIRLLCQMFPSAKFVHIIRDGRNVALSLMSWATKGKRKGPAKIAKWDESPIAVCALWWQWLVNEGLQQASLESFDRCFLISYEGLIEQPQQELETLCQFLGIQYSPMMMDFHRRKVQATSTKRSAKSAWLPPTKGLRSWQNDMPSESVELFEALAGPTLTKLGYQVQTQSFRKSILEQANQFQEWWNRNFLKPTLQDNTPVKTR